MTVDPRRRVLVAMSGGVDSSVAACLLAEQGFSVVGVFMALVQKDGHSGCCSIDDKRDARRIAESRGFKFLAVNYQAHFDDLKAYFLAEYDRGRTPNPCVRCNSQLKFGELVALADKLRCHYVATGHYARIIDGQLYRGIDPSKDQSYALAMIDPSIMSRLLLPIGGFEKTEIRRLAGEHFKLSLFAKPDSQDLCFVRDNYRDLLKATGRLTPGAIVLPTGEKIAEHSGFQQFTLGQRRGIGIGGGGKIFRVVAIRPDTAEVVVSADPADLEQNRIELDGVTWLAKPPAFPAEVFAQIRYQGATYAGTVETDGSCTLAVPAKSITPGQLCAFYDAQNPAYVLGGGFIARGVRHLAPENRPAPSETVGGRR